MSECYQATFRWPHRNASNVIITGSFDGWSCSRYLTKSNSGFFEGIVQIPWGEKVAYKYIVDGRWATTDDRPTEMDNEGNLNNVYRAPARPESPFKPMPAPVPAPAPAEPEEEPKEQAGQTETEATEGTSVGAVGALGAVTATVVGVVETAKQAAVDMVEAMAPGTTDTPAETPVVETPQPEPTPAPAPEATEASEAAPAPALTHESEPTPPPVPEPSQPEVAAPDTTAAILPSEPTPVAPIVPVTILPLSTEPASESVTAPLADVSESKSLDTTVVEGTSTTDTSSPPAPVSAPAPETAPSTHVPAPANATVDEKPLAEAAGPSEQKPATNGDGPSEDKAAVTGTPAANGADAPKSATTDGTTPATTDSTPKPETGPVNGAEQAAPHVNGKTPATTTTTTTTTPTKEKKMRFPSLSSRSSKHTRGGSSAENTAPSHGASEQGERTANGDGKDTVSSRFTGSQRHKRTSIFGKIKEVFSHHKNEPPSS